jgi:type III restriction enzyme
MIEFKDYQEKAIVKLKTEINELLESQNDEVIVFKSPTGSGKTLMTAEFLRRLIDARIDGKKFAFVWIAVNKLHDQSRNSLKKYFDQQGVGLRCSYFQDLENRQIRQNEILFLNWASINKEDNVIVRANERDNNLNTVIERTKEAGRTIILIIDESHHTANSDKSQDIIKQIGPKITIEVSATPQIKSDYIVPVKIEDVRKEGMIKKEVVVNDGFENYVIDKRKSDESADELILRSAIEKRNELQKILEKKENSSVNPLLLIQLPDNKKGVPDKKEDVLRMLSKFGYVKDDPRLAIYLTGNEKINLDNIEKPENEVEVMLFKQAIALGWDCPRATILVLFRQWTDENITFSIQTLGRVMRMPEHRHYGNDELNRAYLYTSLPDIDTRIDKDILPDFKVHKGLRIDSYKGINLISYHSKRFREETRLSSDFYPIFEQAAKELDLAKKVSFKHSIVDTKLIASGRIIDTDKEAKDIERAGTLALPKTESELQFAFDMFVRDNLDPFAPETRSIKRINSSLYTFFGASRDEDRWPEIQAVVLAEDNRQAVIDVINRAKELYQEKIGKGKNKLVENDEPWNVPEVINYNISFKKKDYKKSAIQPYFAKTAEKGPQQKLIEEDSSVEVDFMDFLESAKQVNWWFKNGASDATYFAVPYVENDVDLPFYVDFVVQMKDGSIGLFDTKGGIYAKTAKERAEGLVKYIKEQNKKGKKLFGGIIIKEKKSWRYNDSEKYEYNPNDLKDWKFLKFE